MCSLALPTVIAQLNKYLRHCLWRKFGTEENGMALVAWDKITKPKNSGGLGVLNILEHNKALVMQNVYKFLNQDNLPWVKLVWETYYSSIPPLDKREGSFWWKMHISLLRAYKEICTCVVQSGNTIHFCLDPWNEDALQHQFTSYTRSLSLIRSPSRSLSIARIGLIISTFHCRLKLMSNSSNLWTSSLI